MSLVLTMPRGGKRPGSGRKLLGGRMLAVRITKEQGAKLDAARGEKPVPQFVKAWLESL